MNIEKVIIETFVKIGDTVYFVTDKEQTEHLVTAIIIEQKSIKFRVGNADGERECFDFEISREKKII